MYVVVAARQQLLQMGGQSCNENKGKIGMVLMRKKRKFYGVMLLILALLIMQLPVSEADAAASASASDFQISGTTLVKYNGSSEVVTIPSTVDTIGESAFENNTNMKQVNIPSSVTEIKPYAFWGCSNLETISFGSGLKEIGDYVFANCKGIKNITIPSNIARIGIQAFADCVNMTDITIPAEVVEIHDSAFDGCVRLTIHAPDGSAADQYIDSFIVKQAEMPEYEDVPIYESEEVSTEEQESQESQETSETQEESSNQEDNLLGSTRVVGNNAFVFLNNRDLSVNTGLEERQTKIQDSTGLSGAIQGGKQFSREEIAAVEKGGSLPKYTLIDQTKIADQAYYRNKELMVVDLPEGIQEIGQFSFARSSLAQVSLPQSLQTIGYGAFYSCENLEKVELPENIQNIEPKAFEHTAWLEQFLNYGDADYLISGNVIVAYRGNSSQVDIPEGVRIIAADAFAGHSEITSVNLPDSIEVIGEGAFENCSNLSKISGGTNVKQIKDRAFAGCRFDTVRIAGSVGEIGLGAFAQNTEGSAKAAVFHGTQLPVSSYETSAARLSNEAYRKSAFDGLLFAVIEPEVGKEQIEGSVLSSPMAMYRGIICSIGQDGRLHCRYSNLTKEEQMQLEIPDTIMIYGTEYEVTDKDVIETLMIDHTPITPGMVQITGLVVDVQASLEGASEDGYELRIEEAAGIDDAEKQELERAYQRIYYSALPSGTLVYHMVLKDKEGVPITKLGKQNITITFPVPQSLTNQEIQVLTIDRNGQLEKIDSEIVQTQQGNAIRFTTNHFSPYAFYGKGTMFAEAKVVDGEAVVMNYGRLDDSPDTGDAIHPKWFLGMGLLFLSIAMIVSADNRIYRKIWKINSKVYTAK